MRIALVTTNLVPGDAQSNHTENLYHELKKYHEVDIYAFDCSRNLEVKKMGGHSLRANLSNLLHTRKLAKELSTYKLIVAAGPDFGLIPAMHLSGVRIKWAYHDLTPERFLFPLKDKALSKFRRFVYRQSMLRSAGVAVDSEYTAKELGLPCEVIPFGVDLSRFSPKEEHHDMLTLIYVGRLAYAKHIHLIMLAMAQARKECGLIVVGRGPVKDWLEEYAKNIGLNDEEGLNDRVHFAGFVSDEDLPAYYNKADIFVSASAHEGFCVPIVEAMACGKPCLVHNVGAMPETMGSGGLVFNRSPNLAGLLDLMQDANIRKSAGERALARSKYFELEKCMTAYREWLVA